MSWLSIIGGIISLVQSLVSWLHERAIIDAATKDVLLKNAQESLAAIDAATKARAKAKEDWQKHPEDHLKDDGFKRPD